MFLFNIIYIRPLYLVEFFLQLFIFYNLVQLLKQTNFYYLLSYFILVIVYIGLFLIIYDFDLNAAILWIIYSGVIIIFFLFSIMWIDVFKNFYKDLSIKNNFFNFFLLLFFLVYFIFNTKIQNLHFQFLKNCYINYYNYNSKDIFKELELLGWGIIYYTPFLFILISYFLLLNCLIIIFIINYSKERKYSFMYNYHSFFFKKNVLLNLNIIKNQYFYIQNSNSIYQNHTITKNYKITNYYHTIKNINRRV